MTLPARVRATETPVRAPEAIGKVRRRAEGDHAEVNIYALAKFGKPARTRFALDRHFAGAREAYTDSPSRSSDPVDRAAVLAAVKEAIESRHFDAPELQAAVTAFAGRSRSVGVPPEQLVIQLKAIVRDDTLLISDWWRSVLTDRIVRWGVEGYYHLEPDDADDTSADGEPAGS